MTDRAIPTLWIDVDDILDYLTRHSRPSGIQRVAFEIAQALHQTASTAEGVRFVHRGNGPRNLVTVDWDRIATRFNLVSQSGQGIATTRAVTVDQTSVTTSGRLCAGRKQILKAALETEVQAVLMLARLAGVIGTKAAASMRGLFHKGTAHSREHELMGPIAQPGDIFLVLGSPWHYRDYAQTVRWVRDDLRMRFALLIHDIIPVRRPEWCDPGVADAFVRWHKQTLPLSDHIFTNSRATADDVVRWAKELAISLSSAVEPIPIGTGLQQHWDGSSLQQPTRTPARGTYALFVSTLEARKNHILLFRIWRRLLSELPRERVPTLVFAGRVGWLVADLMQQLENANWLDGKIVLIRDPSDAELIALYEGCQFTLFPSLYEGWGLPVTESLALGRPCISSNRASLPEAGGKLARYFDPENLDDAYRAVRAVIDDPENLAAWRSSVICDFRHVPWKCSAEAINNALCASESGSRLDR